GFSYDINWWFINIENNKSGELAMGFYRTHRDKTEFVIVYETENWRGKNVKKAYYIDENGHCGKSNGSLE
ncbi:MAG: hypothetical protein K6B72_11495, partial [Lachnospiraceae bacterium]|nr:hypothetical protein [Lachnospiraceae bacterium]MCR5094584.1 hypothetical protein [Lachnospiraceae bacterium]